MKRRGPAPVAPESLPGHLIILITRMWQVSADFIRSRREQAHHGVAPDSGIHARRQYQQPRVTREVHMDRRSTQTPTLLPTNIQQRRLQELTRDLRPLVLLGAARSFVVGAVPSKYATILLQPSKGRSTTRPTIG